MAKGADAERFAATFAAAVDTPEGIERLRDAVLELALQGRLSHEGRTRGSAELDGLPCGWTRRRFDEVVSFDIGRTPPTKDSRYWGHVEGFPWVSIGDMPARGIVNDTARRVSQLAHDETFRGRLVPAGTLLMSFKLTIGKVAVLAMPAFHNEAIISIRPGPLLTADFLLWFLPVLATHGASKNALMGSTLNRESLSALAVPVPPLDEQKRIVAKVDELMRLIDELEARQAKRLEVQTLFRTTALDALTRAAGAEELSTAWGRVAESFEVLGDGARAVAEIRGTILSLAVRGQLSPLDRNRFQEVLLDDVIEDSFYGPRFGKESYTPNGVPTVRTTDMDFRGRLTVADAPRVKVSDEDMMKFGLRDGDIVVTRTGATIGKCAVYRSSLGPAIPSAYLIRFRFRLEQVAADYILAYLQSPVGQRLLGIGQTGIAQPNVNAVTIRSFPLLLPPLEEQRRIVAKVDALMKLCDDLEAKLRAKEAAASKLVEAVVRELVA